MKTVNDFGKSENLKGRSFIFLNPLIQNLGFERIRACLIETEPFTVQNGLLTPTQKAKRFAIQNKYKDALETLYTQ